MVCSQLRQKILPQIFSIEYFQPQIFPKLRFYQVCIHVDFELQG